jgi:hypothetical protein
MNRNMRATIHRSVTTYGVQNFISDTLRNNHHSSHDAETVQDGGYLVPSMSFAQKVHREEISMRVTMLDLLKPHSEQNPLGTFLCNAESEMRIALGVHSIENADELEAFVMIQEELNFTLDLCHRVQRLSAAFDLLCDLTDRQISFRRIENENRGAAGSFTFTEKDEQARIRIRAESELLTHYLYYEPCRAGSRF